MAIHSSILAWKIPLTEEPGRLQSMGSQRVGHDLATKPAPLLEGSGLPGSLLHSFQPLSQNPACKKACSSLLKRDWASRGTGGVAHGVNYCPSSEHPEAIQVMGLSQASRVKKLGADPLVKNPPSKAGDTGLDP